jgi:uncharacterized protein
VGAVLFSIIIGLLMHLIYRNEEIQRVAAQAAMPVAPVVRPLWKNALYFASMVGILIFANWARSGDVRAVFLCCPGGLTTYQIEGTMVSKTEAAVTIVDTTGKKHELPRELLQSEREVRKNSAYELIHRSRWVLVAALLIAFAVMVSSWFSRSERIEWVEATWGFALQILPLLLFGILISGLLLGRPGPGHEGVIPNAWVSKAVGGNSIQANLFAAVAGAFMYFATLTEIPILQGLMGAGMGKGPALALLLAGPALSLPSMLVLRSIMGTGKTVVYVSLVVVMATITGIIFGSLFG